MDGSGISEFRGKIGKHGVEDFRFDGGGGVVIEVDAVHSSGLRIASRKGEVKAAKEVEEVKELKDRNLVGRANPERQVSLSDRESVGAIRFLVNDNRTPPLVFA
jgi:hypothetical protein